jgi:Lipopolysaccharide biosynthesis proteins, LPS:glycosyltransferases
MNIVYAMTHHVYEWILPSLRSLAEHHPDARVFILAEHDELPFRLPMPAEIINVSEQTYFPKGGVNYNNDFKYINLLKVRYPSILPADKVIHLDIDTIVCGPIDGLWETDLTGKWFGAVPEKQTWYRPFGPGAYYNMGVAVINLRQMREDGIEAAMQEYLNTVKQPFADQDAWNKYAAGRAVAVDNCYNESGPTGRTEHPSIVHYCGIKDWFTRTDMPRIEYLNRYREG